MLHVNNEVFHVAEDVDRACSTVHSFTLKAHSSTFVRSVFFGDVAFSLHPVLGSIDFGEQICSTLEEASGEPVNHLRFAVSDNEVHDRRWFDSGGVRCCRY